MYINRRRLFHLFALALSLLIISACKNHDITFPPGEVRQDSIAAPSIILLDNLPDSSKPEIVLIDTMPKPLTMAVPVKAGGSYKISTFNGIKEFNLQPPLVTSLLDSASGLPVVAEAQGTGLFTTFNTENGLAFDNITGSLVDSSGVLWFCSESGVSRYDGNKFTTFTSEQGLVNTAVYKMMIDRKGNMWFATADGASRYDGKTFFSLSKKQGLTGSVRSILEDRSGIFWFGTTEGVGRYDGKEVTFFTSEQGLAGRVVRSMVQDRTGIIWFGTDKGVSQYDGKKFTTITTEQGLANNFILSMLEDKDGNMWFGTHSGGVSRYDGKTFTNFTTADGLPYNVVRCIYQDASGIMWFGTDRGGASRYDGKHFTNFSVAQGLAGPNVWSIVQDHSGSMWFGILGSGVSRYDGSSFTNFPFRAACVLQDSTGDLWFGQNTGLTRYNGTSLITYRAEQGFATNTATISCLQDQEGNFWLGTFGGGVFRFDGKTFTGFTKAQGFSGELVWDIAQDKNGNFWFCTNDGGICRFDGKVITNYTMKQGLPTNGFFIVKEDPKGNLWFGSEAGVTRFDGKSFINYSTEQGLPVGQIASMGFDSNGSLWVGTEKGVCEFSKAKQLESVEAAGRHEKIKGPLFEIYDSNDGLPDINITQIYFDSQDRIYLGTYKGLCELIRDTAGKQMHNWRIGKIFNMETGYPVQLILPDQPSLFKDAAGIYWIGTNGSKSKLVRFDPNAVLQYRVVQPMIRSIKINGENICWTDLKEDLKENSQLTDSTILPDWLTEEAITFGKPLNDSTRKAMQTKYRDVRLDDVTPWYYLPGNLVLPYAHNNITFDFNAVETAKNSLVRYRYILEGYDKDWSTVTSSTTANFGNIFEGTYTFKVKAQNADGVWGEPVSWSFKVLPPWWRTWWMYVAYVVMLISFTRTYSQWKQRKLIYQNLVLENKIAIATTEIRAERDKSDALLLNILPEEVAEELKVKGSAEAKQFDEVTVMFTDFKGFTQISEKLTPTELVSEIHICFKAFDNIITKYNIEKIKTIGDAYMCAGGLPVTNTTNAADVVNAAMEIQQFMQQHLHQRQKENKPLFEIRIGVHTGPVVAGIVGVKKFAYDIWGDTVNIASRMESSGEAGKVNISGSTYELVKDRFTCIHRGKILAKNKGEIDMYFVETVS